MLSSESSEEEIKKDADEMVACPNCGKEMTVKEMAAHTV